MFKAVPSPSVYLHSHSLSLVYASEQKFLSHLVYICTHTHCITHTGKRWPFQDSLTASTLVHQLSSSWTMVWVTKLSSQIQGRCIPVNLRNIFWHTLLNLLFLKCSWSDAVLWNPHLQMEACYKDFVCVENAKVLAYCNDSTIWFSQLLVFPDWNRGEVTLIIPWIWLIIWLTIQLSCRLKQYNWSRNNPG